jgi:hypothetical protein
VFRVEYDDDLYKIHVKVENFKPEELIVKTVDNTVQVGPTLYHRQPPAHPGSRSEQPVLVFGQSTWITIYIPTQYRSNCPRNTFRLDPAASCNLEMKSRHPDSRTDRERRRRLTDTATPLAAGDDKTAVLISFR